ncbi:hypothetical protein CYMTET_22293, partial [Cymbomonas tetramitiformis]
QERWRSRNEPESSDESDEEPPPLPPAPHRHGAFVCIYPEGTESAMAGVMEQSTIDFEARNECVCEKCSRRAHLQLVEGAMMSFHDSILKMTSERTTPPVRTTKPFASKPPRTMPVTSFRNPPPEFDLDDDPDSSHSPLASPKGSARPPIDPPPPPAPPVHREEPLRRPSSSSSSSSSSCSSSNGGGRSTEEGARARGLQETPPRGLLEARRRAASSDDGGPDSRGTAQSDGLPARELPDARSHDPSISGIRAGHSCRSSPAQASTEQTARVSRALPSAEASSRQGNASSLPPKGPSRRAASSARTSAPYAAAGAEPRVAPHHHHTEKRHYGGLSAPNNGLTANTPVPAPAYNRSMGAASTSPAITETGDSSSRTGPAPNSATASSVRLPQQSAYAHAGKWYDPSRQLQRATSTGSAESSGTKSQQGGHKTSKQRLREVRAAYGSKPM